MISFFKVISTIAILLLFSANGFSQTTVSILLLYTVDASTFVIDYPNLVSYRSLEGIFKFQIQEFNTALANSQASFCVAAANATPIKIGSLNNDAQLALSTLEKDSYISMLRQCYKANTVFVLTNVISISSDPKTGFLETNGFGETPGVPLAFPNGSSFPTLNQSIGDGAHAYAIAAVDYAASKTIMAHEVGHNFGLMHDLATLKKQANQLGVDVGNIYAKEPSRYGHGYVDPSSTPKWHTIMAYPMDLINPSIQIPYFSTPQITPSQSNGIAIGVPIGTMTSTGECANSVQFLNENVSIYKSWHANASAISNNPSASFTVASASQSQPTSVYFDGSSSTDPNATKLTNLTYLWNFGDGSSGTGIQITHTYSKGGSYPVTLSVSNGMGTGQQTTSINVFSSSNSLQAIITSNVLSGNIPLTVNFDATKSICQNTGNVSCTWDFKDGSTGSGWTIAHTFKNSGDYNVTLTLTNTDGTSSMSTVTIHATTSTTSDLAILNVTALPATGTAPLTVSFCATPDPSNLLDAKYAWDFGGGNIIPSTLSNWTYWTPGTYSATFTFSDNKGNSVHKTVSVVVYEQERQGGGSGSSFFQNIPIKKAGKKITIDGKSSVLNIFGNNDFRMVNELYFRFDYDGACASRIKIDFGDGCESSWHENYYSPFEHTYAKYGSYKITIMTEQQISYTWQENFIGWLNHNLHWGRPNSKSFTYYVGDITPILNLLLGD
jgi:PKD repeat protein